MAARFSFLRFCKCYHVAEENKKNVIYLVERIRGKNKEIGYILLLISAIRDRSDDYLGFY